MVDFVLHNAKILSFSDNVIQLTKNNFIKHSKLTNRNFFTIKISIITYIEIL